MVQVVKPSARRPRFWIFVCLAVLGLSAAALAYWHFGSAGTSTTTARPQTVPVTVASVVTQDVPVYLSGLGIVQASNTTSIHTQVDGKLQSVNFTEGQMVRRGGAAACGHRTIMA